VTILRYIDGILIRGPDEETVCQSMNAIVQHLQELNVDITDSTWQGPSQEVTFLGIWWIGRWKTVPPAQNKKKRRTEKEEEIKEWENRKAENHSMELRTEKSWSINCFERWKFYLPLHGTQPLYNLWDSSNGYLHSVVPIHPALCSTHPPYTLCDSTTLHSVGPIHPTLCGTHSPCTL